MRDFFFPLSIVLFLILLLAFLVIEGRADAKSKLPSLPTVTHIYTMERCPRCIQVEQVLSRHGIDTKVDEYVSTVPLQAANGFPSVYYSYGAPDTGERILERRCFWNKPIQIIKYDSMER